MTSDTTQGAQEAKRIALKRTIEGYRKCYPRAMAFDQSDTAKMFAFEDMRSDIMSLWTELLLADANNLRLKRLLCKAGYPRRGTKEEHMTLQEFAALVQQEISHAEAVELPNESCAKATGGAA